MFGRVVIVAALIGLPAAATAQTRAGAFEQQVKENVLRYPRYTIFDNVELAFDRRTVTVSGQVTEAFKRQELGERIAAVDGVERVINNLEVLPLSFRDSELRTRVAQAIYNHPAFWRYGSMDSPPIHVIVTGGRVRLVGHVATELERSLAYALAQVPGSFRVTNDLRIESAGAPATSSPTAFR